jgi:hypothetical protein
MDPYTACLIRLDITLDQQGWDSDPGLYTLTQTEPGKRVTAAKLPIPNSTWYGVKEPYGPAQALIDFAARHPHGNRTADNQVGWLFACEAWAIEGDGEAARNRVRRLQRQRTMHLAPDRIEIRTVNLITFTGLHLTTRRVRGENLPHVDDMTTSTLSGAIPGALRHLCGLPDPFRVRA